MIPMTGEILSQKTTTETKSRMTKQALSVGESIGMLNECNTRQPEATPWARVTITDSEGIHCAM